MIEKALLIAFAAMAIFAISDPAIKQLRRVGERIETVAKNTTNPKPCQSKFGSEFGCYTPSK